MVWCWILLVLVVVAKEWRRPPETCCSAMIEELMLLVLQEQLEEVRVRVKRPPQERPFVTKRRAEEEWPRNRLIVIGHMVVSPSVLCDERTIGTYCSPRQEKEMNEWNRGEFEISPRAFENQTLASATTEIFKF